MQSKRLSKVVLITMIAVIIAVVVLAVLGLMGYPLLIFESDGSMTFFVRSPFWTICDEIHDLTVSFLGSLTPAPPGDDRYFAQTYNRESQWELYWESYDKIMLQYLIDNDFIAELNAFEELLQKARQTQLNPQNQRSKSVYFLRSQELDRIENALTDIRMGIEAAQKYDGINNPVITQEDRLLFNSAVRWSRGFRGYDKTQ